MTRSTRFTLSLAVAAGLAVPVVADAQTAIPRPAGGSSAGSSSSGSSGSSSSGSSSGGSTSSGAPDRPMTMGSSGDQGGVRRNPAGSRSSGSASSRGTSSSRPSGSASSRPGSASASRGASGGSSDAGYRDRNGRVVRGSAVERRGNITYVDLPFFGSWGGWYPYYGLGYGYGRYGLWGSYYGSPWGWTRYGWYSPYWYDPFYDPYYGGGGYRSYDEDEYEESERRTGSIRIRANRPEAAVYINGAFVGKVDDFDGLTDHLELEAGIHQIELRFDGYETYRGELTVEVGKTRTERVSLKKIK